MNHKWLLQFRPGLDLSFNEKSLFFTKNGKEFSLALNPETFGLLNSIQKKKPLKDLLEKKAVLNMLFALGLTESVLLKNRRPLLSMTSLPSKVPAKLPRHFELPKEFYFHHEKNQLKIKNSSNGFELIFYSPDALTFLFSSAPSDETKLVISQLMNNMGVKKNNAPSWEYLDILFHERTSPSNSYLSYKQLPAKKLRTEKIKLLPKEQKILPERKSRRVHGPEKISLKAISSFFYNIGKKEYFNHQFYGPHHKRSYPSAGGAYENEFYLVANECEKLKKGIYRYDGFRHGLERLEVSQNGVEAFLDEASKKARMSGRPQSVVVVTSKIPLLQKKYQRIPYRLALLNTGVVTAYLDILANKLGLAGRPTGVSDWRFFEKLTGIDSTQEMSLMEFILGVQSEDE